MLQPLRMGLREANQSFSAAIRAVRAGRRVVLTDRGRPIAVLQPIDAGGEKDEGREQLASRGLLVKATRKGSLPRFRPVRLRGMSIARTIRRERDQEV